jgi:Sigma-70, region 4
VLQRYEAGETLAAIGARVGLTRERIRQIVKVSGAPMPWDDTCAMQACATSPRTPDRYCWFHQRRFDRYGDPLGGKPRLMDQHGTLAGYQRGHCRCQRCRRRNPDGVREYVHCMHPEMQYRVGGP